MPILFHNDSRTLTDCATVDGKRIDDFAANSAVYQTLLVKRQQLQADLRKVVPLDIWNLVFSRVPVKS